MTQLRDEALRQIAGKVLARRTGPAAGSEALAAAARRAYDDLALVTSLLIGRAGVEALTARALYLAQQEHPWLVDARETEHANEPFARVVVALAGQDPSLSTEGARTVFATLAGLLATFIGEPLTASLLRKAWPEAFSDVHTEEM